MNEVVDLAEAKRAREEAQLDSGTVETTTALPDLGELVDMGQAKRSKEEAERARKAAEAASKLPTLLPMVLLVDEVRPFNDLATTEGYDVHRAEVLDWLTSLMVGRKKDMTSLSGKLVEFKQRYGFLMADGTAPVRISQNRRPEIELQRDHLGSVVMSPSLSTFQKIDLLTLGVDAMYYGASPVDGHAIARRVVNHSIRRIAREGKGVRGGHSRRCVDELAAHLQDIKEFVLPALQRMSRSDYYRHVASQATGERVTNRFKAFGIVMAISEMPTPDQVAEMRARRRQDLIRKRDKHLEASLAASRELTRDSFLDGH
ncbi:MAG TPA: hypothetical protein VLG37_02565 [Candidatus Saccharimonadales bacterium]|nr:hypothetical protein [Candidatus Saccharimonadales bacterium]